MGTPNISWYKQVTTITTYNRLAPFSLPTPARGGRLAGMRVSPKGPEQEAEGKKKPRFRKLLSGRSSKNTHIAFVP